MLISKFSTGNEEASIASLEQKYRIRLPAQYRNFLRKYNGGYTPKTEFTVGKISSDLRGFLGLGNVELSFNDIPVGNWVKNNLFPVACDSFGNFIAINLDNENVYFVDHENEGNAEHIASSFEFFLNCCICEKINPASRRSIKEREDALIAKGRGSIITDDLRQLWQNEIDKYGSLTQEEVLLN